MKDERGERPWHDWPIRLWEAPRMPDLASYSIYTMRHSKTLREQAAEGGSHRLHE
jgi:hypothetical protein